MSEKERRETERQVLQIPIRVIGSDPTSGDFTEDAQTVVVNQAGARIALKHKLTAGGTIRIINLESYSEADFRVVGSMSPTTAELSVWGVECIEPERNIWGLQFPPPISSEGSKSGILLECRGCKQQVTLIATPMEIEVLEATGLIVYQCNQCKKDTYWTYADAARRPPAIEATDSTAPQTRGKRAYKRLIMKLPILLRNEKGQEETARTENLSKSGLAAYLAIELAVGDIVFIVCPYTPGGQNIEQKASVRYRHPDPVAGKRLYGLGYLK